MLRSLLIENYALIEKLDISFDDGLSIITGETGAGKSILLGALGLILGQRADTSVLFDKNRKCIIEGTFMIGNLHLEPFFRENELDYDDQAIFRREINPQGKSRAFINDTPVNLPTMKVLAERLIDIHSQHQNLVISQSSFRFNVVDSFAGSVDNVLQYRREFDQFVWMRNQLQELSEQEKQTRADLDYFQFQYDELYKAALQPGEFRELEEELEILNHAAEIKVNLEKTEFLLQNAPENILEKLSEVSTLFRSLENYSAHYSELSKRIKSTEIEIKDIAHDIERQMQDITDDPHRASVLQQRYDLIQKLIQKHNVTGIEELILVRDEFKNKIYGFESLEAEIEALKKEYLAKEDHLLSFAEEISSQRKKAIPMLEKQIIGILNELGMPNGRFRVELVQSPELHANGIDNISFLFNANLGGELQELSRVASGGELSRLMLAVKSVISMKNLLPTIIFDEIDTGVSGEIGFKMGHILERIAKNMQVISITHLPQVAAKGEKHFVVFKTVENNHTKTRVKKLENAERVKEIAKMLGGENPSEKVFETAKELINQSIHKN
jgi:DNA repair protein RecN (Recombination protein N)